MSKLYLISPDKISNLSKFSQELASVLSTNMVSVFQLRLKNIDISEIKKAIDVLLPICHNYGVPFFINDHYPLARDYAIDGIHIGQDDGDVKILKKEFGKEKIIGVSCQNSKHKAMVATEKGADYVAFGAFFETKSKENTVRAEIDTLLWWLEQTNIPACAIGGINHKNIAQIAKTEVDFICMISAVWQYPKGAKQAVLDFAKFFKE